MTWIRPTTLEELLELKMKHPQAKLVIGNTEIGKHKSSFNMTRGEMKILRGGSQNF